MSCRNAEEEESAARATKLAPDAAQAESAVAEIAKQRFDECCRHGDDKSRLTFFVAALCAAYTTGEAAHARAEK